MFELAAPHPAIEVITLLPNPELGNSEALSATLDVKRGMDGTLYTYLKKHGNGRRKMIWTFRLRRPKALELKAFIKIYFAKKIRIVDHASDTWIGNFTNNPFEFDAPRRAGPAVGGVSDQLNVISLEFEGLKQ